MALDRAGDRGALTAHHPLAHLDELAHLLGVSVADGARRGVAAGDADPDLMPRGGHRLGDVAHLHAVILAGGARRLAVIADVRPGHLRLALGALVGALGALGLAHSWAPCEHP